MKISISEKAVREYLREAMFSEAGWNHLDDPAPDPVKQNPVVDPSAALTDPNNEQIPQNKPELKISLNAMIDSQIEDIDTQKAYNTIKKAIQDLQNDEIEKDEKMKNSNVHEAIRRAVKKTIKEATSADMKLETMIRANIRKLLREAAGSYKDTGMSFSGHDGDPAGMVKCDRCHGIGSDPDSGDDCTTCGGEGRVKKTAKYTTSKELEGATTTDIVAALGLKSAGRLGKTENPAKGTIMRGAYDSAAKPFAVPAATYNKKFKEISDAFINQFEAEMKDEAKNDPAVTNLQRKGFREMVKKMREDPETYVWGRPDFKEFLNDMMEPLIKHHTAKLGGKKPSLPIAGGRME